MKIKLLVMAALLGVASLPAHAGVRFGFSVGLPLPVPVVVAPPVAVFPGPACYPVGGYGRCYVGGGWHYGSGRYCGRPFGRGCR